MWEKFTDFFDPIEWQLGPVDQDGHFHYKNIYRTIKEFERNWRIGSFTFYPIDYAVGEYDIAWKLSEKYLATRDGSVIKLWDRDSFICEKVFQGHEQFVNCLQFDNNFLISGSYDKTIRIWDLETTEMASYLHCRHFLIFTIH